MSLHVSRAALAGVVMAFAFASGPAFAADAKAIADAFVAATTAANESQATYESATSTGDDVTITGYKSVDGDDTVSIPSIVISSPKPREPGGFTAPRMTFDGGTVQSSGNTITWKTGAATDVTLMSAAEVKAKAHDTSPFSRIEIGAINASGGELAAPIDIASFAASVAIDADGTPSDIDMNINAITIPAAFYESESTVRAIVDELGYNGFIINVGVSGAYDTKTDTVTLRGFTIDTVDAGKLAIDGKFSGVPLSKMADESKQAEIAASGKLESLTIRFDNAGIVQRLLDMQAKMMGGSRDDVIANNTGALPFLLMGYPLSPEFQEKIAAAGVTFLKDPKSITISARPAQPVPFSQIESTLQTAPNTLTDVLGVDIQVNN